MRKEKDNSSRIRDNGNSNFTKKKRSWMDNFKNWFHRFLEVSE